MCFLCSQRKARPPTYSLLSPSSSASHILLISFLMAGTATYFSLSLLESGIELAQMGHSVLTGWLALIPLILIPGWLWRVLGPDGPRTEPLPRISGAPASFTVQDTLPIIFFKANLTNLLPSSSFHMRFDIQNMAASCSLTCEWPY